MQEIFSKNQKNLNNKSKFDDNGIRRKIGATSADSNRTRTHIYDFKSINIKLNKN